MCSRGREHRKSEYESVYPGLADHFLKFIRDQIIQYFYFFVILLNVQNKNNFVEKYAIYRYYITGNFVDKSLAFKWLNVLGGMSRPWQCVHSIQPGMKIS